MAKTKFDADFITVKKLKTRTDLTVQGTINTEDAVLTTDKIVVQPVRTTDSYEYGLKIDSDDFFTGEAATKSYMLAVIGDRDSAYAATGDSNDALVRVSGSNYAANDANFILRGINANVTNRSGGTMGRMENFLGVQNKSGGSTPVLIGLTAITENYGTNATEAFAIDAISRDEVGAGTTRAVIRMRNDDRSGVAAMDAAALITSHASSGGYDTLINAQGATLTEYDSGTQVVLMTFKDAAGTTQYLIHDSDAATVLEVATSVSV